MDNRDLGLADSLRSAAAASPRLVLSGHVHNPARWKDRCGGTISLNPGVGTDPTVPNYISIDTARRRARWFRDGELADVAKL
jgi:Icc-related predicted phosphoesterase